MAVAPLPLGKEEEEIQTKEINALGEMNISRKIIFYANQEALRPIALCYRDFESWPPHGVKLDWDGDSSWEALATDLTLIGIIAIEDPLHGVCTGVAKCHKSGVAVKMWTGDNIPTARSIANQYGILEASSWEAKRSESSVYPS